MCVCQPSITPVCNNYWLSPGGGLSSDGMNTVTQIPWNSNLSVRSNQACLLDAASANVNVTFLPTVKVVVVWELINRPSVTSFYWLCGNIVVGNVKRTPALIISHWNAVKCKYLELCNSGLSLEENKLLKRLKKYSDNVCISFLKGDLKKKATNYFIEMFNVKHPGEKKNTIKNSCSDLIRGLKGFQ